MRASLLLVAFGGLAAIGLAAVSGASRLAGDGQSDASATSFPEIGIQQQTPQPPAEALRAPFKARAVAPETIAPPPLEPETLERVAPRAPLGELALALPPQPGVPGPRLLHRPVAAAAGEIEAQGHVIAIEDIVPIDPDLECFSASGSSWPCGMVARTAFRNWLRGRAIKCVVGEEPAADPVTSPCTLGNQDIALWLVVNGFATPKPGSAYVEAGEKAKAEGRGIFGPGPEVAQ